ncbi:DUF2637 domain-containing protein [Streptomyces sp. WZ-12]|uniref:DUF2637 domain-containing protein n=1 Tax=Streptomyces sp. WZ-12 TaxID=3030210 RepID=UPI002380C6B4|nr:DUF2637 domain-containing protein [Streptomyces sp. WZ-12]
MRLLGLVAIGGGSALAGIGFTGSYSALARLGSEHGFGWFADVFPIGVDVGIVVLLTLDLFLIHRRAPWPVLRLLAHTFTVATIVFNAAAAGPIRTDPVGAAMHAVVPLMFVASVEAGRRLVVRAAQLADGKAVDRIPLHRWILAPWPTWLLYRRMRLWGLPSYTAAVTREQERTVYRVMLIREYGDVDKAPQEARLPLKMAQYGLSVDEALALPAQAEQAAAQRRERAEEAEMEAQARAAKRQAQAEVQQLRTAAEVEEARAEAAALAGAAKATAEGRTAQAHIEAQARTQAAQRAATAAERTAAAESDALQSATAAAALRKAAEDEKAALETRARNAETQKAALETEAAAAEARARIKAAEAAEAAKEKSRAADVEAAEAAKQRAAETRARVAEIELAALEREDRARLKPSERDARRVARMILTDAAGIPESLDLKVIADALGISVTTASDRRKEAAALLSGGYTLPTVDTRVPA